jgi:hypothetical protein
MSLSISPQNIALNPSGTANVVLTSTLGDLTVPTFTVSAPGQVMFGLISGGSSQQTWVVTSSATANATVSVVVKDVASTDSSTFNVSIVPASTGTPQGYTSLDAIALVRLRTNEPNLPVNTDLLILLNEGAQEVERELGAIRLLQSYPIAPGQTIQALRSDVQDVLSCSFSTGPVTGSSTVSAPIVYPMFPMDQGMFMDFAAGTPGASTGPPSSYFIFNDASGVLIMQLYPAGMLGQLNVYYRARPILWTLMGGGATNGVASNLDSAMQQAVILWTCGRVLENRGRSGEAQRFDALFDVKIEAMKKSVAQRTAPKFGQVRDIGYANTGRPYWYRR